MCRFDSDHRHHLYVVPLMHKPQAHVRVDFSASCALGPGKVALLEGIARTGSLSAAARDLGMSYRRGWLLLNSLNTSFSEPAVTLSVGGKDGGGAKLTDFGQELIARYRDFQAAVDALAVRSFAGLHPNPAPGPTETASRNAIKRSLGTRPSGDGD